MAKAHFLGLWQNFGDAPNIEVAVYISKRFAWMAWLLKRIIWLCAYKAENRDKVIAALEKSIEKYSSKKDEN